MDLQSIVFDFDGVIVEESERLGKEHAWEGVAEEFGWGEAGRQARREAQARYAKGRGTRVDILRDTFLALGHPVGQIEELVRHGSERFNALTQDAIVRMGVTEPDRKALESLAARLPLFINTGTPEEAMHETVERLGIAKLFRGVYGMPSGKLANLERARIATDCRHRHVLFVGDGSHDADAAREFGCAFIGRANAHNGWNDPMPFPLIRSLQDLHGHVA